jgi:hypothetical protein
MTTFPSAKEDQNNPKHRFSSNLRNHFIFKRKEKQINLKSLEQNYITHSTSLYIQSFSLILAQIKKTGPQKPNPSN